VARIVVPALALCLLSACNQGSAVIGGDVTVDPLAYRAFYLWPGIQPPAGTNPTILYLLDGEIRSESPIRFTRLRPGSPHQPGKQLWLVVRINRLDWNGAAYDAILADLARWTAAGNQVIGLQVDFDARTSRIASYAQFLATLRQRLPAQYRLSVTGLMDWSANGDPSALADLRTVIDEVVVQTYQGRTTIPGYRAYFAKMDRFPIPFRVALAQGAGWTPPPMLERHPMFRGYVVFVLRNRHGLPGHY
jgi:hypothetical protein